LIHPSTDKLKNYPIMSGAIDKESTLGNLPDEWPSSLMSTIAERVALDDQTIVVLDDDPTGTQTVYDLPVITEWSLETLDAEFSRGTPAFYIMTNSRSLTPDAAEVLNKEIATRLLVTAEKYDRRLSIVSRSDSTLRGHYPLETDAIADTLQTLGKGGSIDGQIIAPFFLEGGRLTIDDVHYVAEGSNLIPAAETPFAKDAAFGFTQSNLLDYVEEKSKGTIKKAEVQSITIDDVRRGGPERVRAKLKCLSNMQACVVNAVSLRDMEVFALGLLDAEAKDMKRFVVRSAATFVQARIGLPKRPILTANAINNDDALSSAAGGKKTGGLVVVGSYVPKTTAQLESLLALDGMEKIEINVLDLIDSEKRPTTISSTLDQVQKAIACGKNTVVYTSRKLMTGNDPSESLTIGNSVSDGLVSIVSKLEVQPRFIIAKGGITSSDVATKGLGIKRAMVLGQAAPGIPVWSIGEEGKFPGMSYVVFPGNVGGNDELSKLVSRLSV